MSENKKKVNAGVKSEKENEKKEVALDQLDEVSGGSIRNIRYTPTKEISDDIKDKI